MILQHMHTHTPHVGDVLSYMCECVTPHEHIPECIEKHAGIYSPNDVEFAVSALTNEHRALRGAHNDAAFVASIHLNWTRTIQQ